MVRALEVELFEWVAPHARPEAKTSAAGAIASVGCRHQEANNSEVGVRLPAENPKARRAFASRTGRFLEAPP
jgi:hypothetical protein